MLLVALLDTAIRPPGVTTTPSYCLGGPALYRSLAAPGHCVAARRSYRLSVKYSSMLSPGKFEESCAVGQVGVERLREIATVVKSSAGTSTPGALIGAGALPDAWCALLYSVATMWSFELGSPREWETGVVGLIHNG